MTRGWTRPSVPTSRASKVYGPTYKQSHQEIGRSGVGSNNCSASRKKKKTSVIYYSTATEDRRHRHLFSDTIQISENHGLYGSASCCISHRRLPSQWEIVIFNPLSSLNRFSRYLKYITTTGVTRPHM